MVKVLIVDDHEVVRQGLRFMLAQEPGIEVVGEAADGAQALDEIRRLRPDVVLLDIVMPGLDGLGVLHALRGEEHPPAVIVLTSYVSPASRVLEQSEPYVAEHAWQGLREANEAWVTKGVGTRGKMRLQVLVC